ncbi:M16 family metallopeptidase [Ferribacterium limneticum]|uniref:M16 family metallopeptidase n=1 Tax=Ferribacterium limneticum TaxID=76259 RepID=UPI001CFC3F20|nr:pitrilysin family protein [Ferribacterium limneticum]UCV28050.1 insulinase family protein [Ferribacterium limneticum]UCV31967.1 insulinase family protein [Ferribacterium limneticum]
MKKLLIAAIALLLTQSVFAGVKIEHWVSPSGARVYFVESRVLPMLDVQVDFSAGSIFDPAGKSGLAALTRAALDLGAGKLDETAIAEQLADIGANLGGGADTDRASVALRTLSARDKREPALDILKNVLHQPLFDAAIFEREKTRTIAGLKEAMTRPDSIAGKAFWAAMYPNHPYGRQATPESVAALNRDDLAGFHARYYNAANASITLVGDLSRQEAEKIAEAIAGGLPKGEAATLPNSPEAPKGGLTQLAHPASQAHVYIGLPAVERGNPDFFPLLVGNYTLGGGGFVSRLMKEVRDKRGYAYSVYSYFAPLKQTGPFQIGLQTKRSQAKDAIKVARDVLEGFLKDGPSDDELTAAKANLTGSFPLRLDSNKKILDNVAVIGFYGLPLDYLDQYQAKVQAVSADDIKQAFARRVRPDNLITVTVAAD